MGNEVLGAWEKLVAEERELLRRLRVRVARPDETEWFAEQMRDRHYLGWAVPVGERVAHVAEADGRPLALLMWTAGAYHLRVRDEWIGWTAAQRRERLGLVVNNSRFLVLEERFPNLASRTLALSAKRLCADWEEAYGHGVLLAESFVNGRKFRGTCYRAAGWEKLGETAGFARVAEGAGFPRAIGFDMGGTSTDVSRYDGQLDRVYEKEVAGVRVRAPMMNIHTVAAGGGSVCCFDGYRMTVGPDSTGARPGPLCYGHPDGRELALTDINLVLGRLQADRFPFPLDRDRPLRALELGAGVVVAGAHRCDVVKRAAGQRHRQPLGVKRLAAAVAGRVPGRLGDGNGRHHGDAR